MRVPRPFEPDPEEIEQPQGRESKEHIEQEEKPLADENQQRSEDFHGGNESTESLPDSPNEGSEEQQEKQQSNDESSADNGQQSQSSNGEQSQQSDGNQSSAGSSSENQDSDNKQSSENSSQGESQQSQNSSEGQQSSSNENSTSDTSKNQQSSSKTESSESSEQSSGETQQSEEQSSNQTGDSFESDDNEQEEASGSSSQVESNGEDWEPSNGSSDDVSEESDSSDGADDSDGQNDETFDTEEEEQEEVSDSDEESEDQVNSGTYNTVQVFDYTSAKNNTKLSRALYDFIEYVADETKVYNNLSADYYEPKKLMLRRYQGKSLNATKSGKVRETIVVLLDNSGSMDWVREHVLETARALIQRHDAEIYFTPNGYVETQLTKQGNEQVKHENVINKIVTQQLKVLYLGDYDGANTPIELSWKTKVFWLCPESRYRRFRSHDWVSYDESDFRGFFARTYDANEMVQALKRFAGFTQFTRYWYDPHEREVFQDD